jgi:hypothetical protein
MWVTRADIKAAKQDILKLLDEERAEAMTGSSRAGPVPRT